MYPAKHATPARAMKKRERAALPPGDIPLLPLLLPPKQIKNAYINKDDSVPWLLLAAFSPGHKGYESHWYKL